MVGPARVLRTIFSRPHFIAYQNEVSLEKMILVDSPSAVSYSVVSDSLNCLSIMRINCISKEMPTFCDFLY